MYAQLIDKINRGEFDEEEVSKALTTLVCGDASKYNQLCHAAFQADGMLIRFSQISSDALNMIAVKQNGLAIKYVHFPTTEIQLAALQQNLDAYSFIKYPSPVVKQYYEDQKSLAQKHDDLWNTGLIEEPIKKVKDLALNDDFLDKLLEKSREYYENVLHCARNELKNASQKGRLHGNSYVYWDLEETEDASRALEILQENITSTRISVSVSGKRISMTIRE